MDKVFVNIPLVDHYTYVVCYNPENVELVKFLNLFDVNGNGGTKETLDTGEKVLMFTMAENFYDTMNNASMIDAIWRLGGDLIFQEWKQ